MQEGDTSLTAIDIYEKVRVENKPFHRRKWIRLRFVMPIVVWKETKFLDL